MNEFRCASALLLLANLSAAVCHAETPAEQGRAKSVDQEVASTPQERAAAYDRYVEMTKDRTAWSPLKWQSLGTTYQDEINRLGLREEFLKADTQQALGMAVAKLFNARRDRHVAISVRDDDATWAPIRFLPNISQLPSPGTPLRTLPLFVANYTQEAERQGIKRGDLLVSINGIPVAEFQEQLELLFPASTPQNAYIRGAGTGDEPSMIAMKTAAMPAHFFPHGDNAVFVLTDRDTGEKKTIKLKYTQDDRNLRTRVVADILGGTGRPHKKHYVDFYRKLGYQLLEATTDGSLWVNHEAHRAILEWYDFEDVQTSTAKIIAAAQRHKVLDYDLIIDATHSSGGGGGYHIVRVLSDRPFKPTFGNVRVADRDFAEKNMKSHGRKVQAWIQDALDQGLEYTTNKPFKLLHGEIIQPGDVVFTGQKVLLTYPWGGSHADQFAAMICDNYQSNGITSIGTTMGGYSNTWEWGETIQPPGLPEEMWIEWNIGHTIRPNGEVLEGNPPRAQIWFPMTPENAGNYFEDLVKRAEQHLVESR